MRQPIPTIERVALWSALGTYLSLAVLVGMTLGSNKPIALDPVAAADDRGWAVREAALILETPDLIGDEGVSGISGSSPSAR